MNVPRGRYRVVERDRRLEVIDTRAASPSPHAASVRNLGGSIVPRRTRFDGGGEVVTRPFYDNKGPRRIALDAASAATIRWTQAGAALFAALLAGLALLRPAVILLAIPLGSERARATIRAPLTRWLDKVERENR